MVLLIFVLIDLLAFFKTKNKTTAIDHKEHENNESMAEFTVYTLSIILSVYGPKITNKQNNNCYINLQHLTRLSPN